MRETQPKTNLRNFFSLILLLFLFCQSKKMTKITKLLLFFINLNLTRHKITFKHGHDQLRTDDLFQLKIFLGDFLLWENFLYKIESGFSSNSFLSSGRVTLNIVEYDHLSFGLTVGNTRLVLMKFQYLNVF